LTLFALNAILMESTKLSQGLWERQKKFKTNYELATFVARVQIENRKGFWGGGEGKASPLACPPPT